MNIPADWIPTADNVNALPDPLRLYIHALETDCDPSGTVRENFRLRAENAGLRVECEGVARARIDAEKKIAAE